jgi:hypothetical protein
MLRPLDSRWLDSLLKHQADVINSYSRDPISKL